MIKRKGIADAHTHHLNRNTVPDNLSKQQSRGFSEGFIRGPLGYLIGGIVYGLRNFSQFIKILDTDNLAQVSRYHVTAMDAAGIDYSIVLALDFSEVDPDYSGYGIGYARQLEAIAENCARDPFRIFPFFFFDPRRPGVVNLLKESYRDRGIVGIKLYPAYGYDPRPEKDDFLPGRTKPVSIKQNLEYLYRFASSRNLPIMSHCSAGGSYLCSIRRADKYKKIWGFTEPSNFLGIAERYRLRICFAHMGGSIFSKRDRELAWQWRNQIYNLIRFSGKNGFQSGSKIYSDLSNFLAHISRNEKRIRSHLAETRWLLDLRQIGRYLLFGSDWPLARFKLDETSYISCYRNYLSRVKRRRFFSDNCADFLFGPGRKIPENYIQLIKKGRQKLILPEWVVKRGRDYYLV